jgi:hypothetical protein
MMQEPRLIHDFNPGDIVTRVQPVRLNNSFVDGFDCSYVGEKLIFVGVANGCAYFEPTDSFSLVIQKGRLIDLPIHRFEDGWAHYIDPITLVNSKRMGKYKSMSDTALVAKLDEAIEAEDYEEASRIKHEIDNREL